MKRAWCSAIPGGVRLAVQIMPNAKKTEVVGIFEDESDFVLKIRLQAQPLEGKANLALIRFLSAALKLPRSAFTISQGVLNKRKVLQIMSVQIGLAQLEALLPADDGT